MHGQDGSGHQLRYETHFSREITRMRPLFSRFGPRIEQGCEEFVL
jgi:hypothetical protein